MDSEAKEILERVDFEETIFLNGEENIKKLSKLYHIHINSFIDAIYKTYKTYKEFEQKSKKVTRMLVISLLYYDAINNLVKACNLLLLGYFNAYGNTIRHFFETLFLAILFSRDNLKKDYLSMYIAGDKNFKVSSVVNYVNENNDKLEVNPESLKSLSETKSLYNQFSHSTFFAQAENFALDQHLIPLGPYIDEDKKIGYERSFSSLPSAARLIENIILNLPIIYKE